MESICITCLKNDAKLTKMYEINKSKAEILQTFRKCVPEMDWKMDHQMCSECLRQLENIYAFRALCIKSYLIQRNREENRYKGLDINESDLDDDNADSTDNRDVVHDEGNARRRRIKIACPHCEEQFDFKKLLAIHVRNSHDSENGRQVQRQVYSCSHCSKPYCSERMLQKHSAKCKFNSGPLLNQDVVVVEEIVIEVSSVVAPERPSTPTSDAITQSKKSDPEPRHRSPSAPSREPSPSIEDICTECGTTFKNKYLLVRHRRNVHATEKPYACDTCPRKFVSPVYLGAHKKYHAKERTHICTFCGKGYITASDLYHHEMTHANKRAYRCERCPKAFNTCSDLHKHRICCHSHRSEWKYECADCRKRFPIKSNLDAHTKSVHTGERNYACHLCARRCVNASALKKHLKCHSNVKPFQCHLCTDAPMHEYKHKTGLNRHLALAHGISNEGGGGDGDSKMAAALATGVVGERVKKYRCAVCPKRYFDGSSLKKHINRTHHQRTETVTIHDGGGEPEDRDDKLSLLSPND